MDAPHFDRLSRALVSRRSVLAGIAGLGLTLLGGRDTEAHNPVPACKQVQNARKRRACLRRARRHNQQHQQTSLAPAYDYESLSGAALCRPEFDVDEDPQTCNNPITWDSIFSAWGRPEPTPLAIKLQSPATNCSALSYVLTWEDQDAVHELVTGLVQPGEAREWQQLGSADDRVRWFSIDAIGSPGGCNEGRLEAYQVSFDLRMPRLP